MLEISNYNLETWYLKKIQSGEQFTALNIGGRGTPNRPFVFHTVAWQCREERYMLMHSSACNHSICAMNKIFIFCLLMKQRIYFKEHVNFNIMWGSLNFILFVKFE